MVGKIMCESLCGDGDGMENDGGDFEMKKRKRKTERKMERKN